jgi:predicted kinase
MKKLIMTVGLPRSGKSTWAKKQNLPIVNPDSIRLAIHGQPFISEAESLVWTIAKYMVKSLFITGHNKVILDATNLTESRRQEWEDDMWEIKYKYFNTSPEECKRRALNTDKAYLLPVIDRMIESAELEGIK